MTLYVAAMACFSLSDVFAKRLAASVPVIEIVWFRYAVLALTLAVLVVRRHPIARPARPWLQISRGLAIAASALLFNLGLAKLPVATATALVFSSPLFVTALSVWVLRMASCTASVRRSWRQTPSLSMASLAMHFSRSPCKSE